MRGGNASILTIILNINGLNFSIERQSLYKKHTSVAKKHCFRVKDRKDISSKQNQKANRFGKIKPKLKERDKENHSILIKKTILQEAIIILNIQTSNIGHKFHKTNTIGKKGTFASVQ